MLPVQLEKFGLAFFIENNECAQTIGVRSTLTLSILKNENKTYYLYFCSYCFFDSMLRGENAHKFQ